MILSKVFDGGDRFFSLNCAIVFILNVGSDHAAPRVSEILPISDAKVAKHFVAGDSDDKWTVLCTLVTGAVQHRHEASNAANAKAFNSLPVSCRDRTIYRTPFQA